MKLTILFFSLLTINHIYGEICRLTDLNSNTIRILGQENSCEADLGAGGAALINSINQANLTSNTPSTTEINTANIMLNYITKNLVNISQLNQLTTSFGNSISPTGTLAASCTLDQINNLGQSGKCAESFSPDRIQALFGKSIEEVVSEHFVAELMKTENNSDAQNNSNQCLSSKDASLVGQQSKRMDLFSNMMMMTSLIEWDSDKGQFKDESLNLQLSNDPQGFLTSTLALNPNDPNLPFISSALKDENGIKSFFQALSRFKSNNPNADLMKREDSWSFYQTLLRDSDLISNMRTTLADQCDNLFKNFTDFICNPMTFHATNNANYIGTYSGGEQTTSLTDNLGSDTTHYMDYLYKCQGAHCFAENVSQVNQSYCQGRAEQENRFNLNEFLTQAETTDPLTITLTDNQLFRDREIYGRASSSGDSFQSPEQFVCDVICQNKPQCSPRKTAEMIRTEFKCGQSNENTQMCTNELKTWLEMQEMQTSYERVIAQRNGNNDGANETATSNTRSEFINHFLGQIGQDVIAGKTPTLSGIVNPSDRTTLSRETLADAADGSSDFDTPTRNRTTPRRKTLTETLADIQQRGSAGNGLSTTEKANLNRGVASVGDALSAARPFTPLQAGSLGSQLASAIPTNDRQAFIEENARLMRDILSGQNRDLRGRINSLDDVLANNERQFNTGVNVNNNFDFPTADDNAGDETNRVSDFGLGVTGAPVEAPNQEVDGEPEPVAGIRRGAASSNNSGAAAVAGSTGTAAATGPRQNNSGPSYAATIDNLETITLEELQNQNIPLDRPFILVINAGDRSVSVRVVPMQHRGETILAPDISGIGEDEYFVYPLLKRATVFKKFFAYREERLNSIRSI